MNKKNKAVEISITEVKENETTVHELAIKKDKIGKVIETAGNFTVEPLKGQVTKVKTLDDGINDLIMAYNLHH